jgi:tRNA pseudouridine65 synthase
VVNKPAGLLVHRTREAPDRVVLLQRLADQVGRYLFPVHRLDRGTTGPVVFGLSSEAAGALQAALQAESARKEYVTLVRGQAGDFWVRRALTNRKGVKQPAETEFTRLATLPRCTLLRARLRTGRRHQIRRHLHHCRHQVIGDRKYGKSRINAAVEAEHGLRRAFLHAALLEVDHPAGGRLEVRCPLPEDLRAMLERLGADPALLAELSAP